MSTTRNLSACSFQLIVAAQMIQHLACRQIKSTKLSLEVSLLIIL